MDKEFENIYTSTLEELKEQRERVKEFKKDIRESEGLIIGIIIICLIISFATDLQMAKYIFVTVAGMMFLFCTIYTFANERKIIARQNKYSEVALAEMIPQIEEKFIYDKDEEISETYYKKSGFDRIYKQLYSKGVIKGIRNNYEILVANIMVKNQTKEIFRGIFAHATLENQFREIDVMTINSKNNRKQKYEVPYQGLYMYSEDTEESRKIITDKVLELVKDFTKSTGLKVEFMVNQNIIFFRFFDNQIFTKPIANDKETKKYLYKYFKIIEFVAKMSKDIDQNSI